MHGYGVDALAWMLLASVFPAAAGMYTCAEVNADIRVSPMKCHLKGRSSATPGTVEHFFAVGTGGGFVLSISLVLWAVDLVIAAALQGWSWIDHAIPALVKVFVGMFLWLVKFWWLPLILAILVAVAVGYFMRDPFVTGMAFVAAFASPWLAVAGAGVITVAAVAVALFIVLTVMVVATAMLLVLIVGAMVIAALIWFPLLLVVGTISCLFIWIFAFVPLGILGLLFLGLLADMVRRLVVNRHRAATRLRPHSSGPDIEDGAPDAEPVPGGLTRKALIWRMKQISWKVLALLSFLLIVILEVVEFAADLSMTNAALLSFMGIADWDVFENVEEHLATSLAEAFPWLADIEWLQALMNGIEDVAHWMPTAYKWVNNTLGFNWTCPGAPSLLVCCQLAAGLAVAHEVQRASSMKAVLNRLFTDSEMFILTKPFAVAVNILILKSFELMMMAGQTVSIFAVKGAPRKEACNFEGDEIMTGITRCLLIISALLSMVVAPHVALPSKNLSELLRGPREFMLGSGQLAVTLFQATFGFWSEDGLAELMSSVQDRPWFPNDARRCESYVQISAGFASLAYQAFPLGLLASKVMQATNTGFVMTFAEDPRLPNVDMFSRVEKVLAFVRAAMLVSIPFAPQDARGPLLWISLAAIFFACLCDYFKHKEPLEQIPGDDFTLTDLFRDGLDRMFSCFDRCSTRCWTKCCLPTLSCLECLGILAMAACIGGPVRCARAVAHGSTLCLAYLDRKDAKDSAPPGTSSTSAAGSPISSTSLGRGDADSGEEAAPEGASGDVRHPVSDDTPAGGGKVSGDCAPGESDDIHAVAGISGHEDIPVDDAIASERAPGDCDTGSDISDTPCIEGEVMPDDAGSHYHDIAAIDGVRHLEEGALRDAALSAAEGEGVTEAGVKDTVKEGGVASELHEDLEHAGRADIVAGVGVLPSIEGRTVAVDGGDDMSVALPEEVVGTSPAGDDLSPMAAVDVGGRRESGGGEGEVSDDLRIIGEDLALEPAAATGSAAAATP